MVWEEQDDHKLFHNGIDMELRRCRWLSKLSAMDETRMPRRMLAAWSITPWLSHRPHQTIRHGYVTTLKILGLETKSRGPT
jgi:hypothetical protein